MKTPTSAAIILLCMAGLLLSTRLNAATSSNGNFTVNPTTGENGDLIVEGNLGVNGLVDFVNGFRFGSTQETTPASATEFLYSESETDYSLTLKTYRPNTAFLWQDNAIGTLKTKMQLDGNNVLSLFDSAGAAGIVFNPTTGGITLAGTGSGLHLSDGTVLSNAASLHSRALYDSGGTARMTFDTNGNLVVSAPMKLEGTGAGIDFGSGNTLNPDNVAYLKQTLSNLGYRDGSAPPDASLSLPPNFTIIKTAIDAQGNGFVVGTFSGSGTIGATTLTSLGNSDLFVVKVDGSGVVQWAKSFGGTNSDHANGIAIDGSGNAYVAGGFSGSMTNGLPQTLTSAGGYDVFVVKVDGSGIVQWAKSFGGTNPDQANGLAVDGSGNAYVAGNFLGSMANGLPQTLTSTGGYADVFVVKVNGSGLVQWAKSFGGTNSDQANGIAVDGSGNTYVAGGFSGSMTNGLPQTLTSAGSSDAFMVKVDGSGIVQWAKSFGGTNSDNANGLAADGSGNAYVAGYFSGSMTNGLPQTLTSTGGYADVFVVKVNGSGIVQWARSFGGTNYDYANGIAVGGSGTLAVAGSAGGNFQVGNQLISHSYLYLGTDTSLLSPPTGSTAGFSWAGSRATSDGAVAVGQNALASSLGSVALGNSTSSGQYSFSTGIGTLASGYGSTATGNGTSASGYSSTAMGYGSTALGDYSTAMGSVSTASGYSSTAMGENSTASGYTSTALGSLSTASGFSSTAMGSGSTALGDSSTAMGNGSTASGYSSTAMGCGSNALGEHSTAMGYYSTSSDYSTAMGCFSEAGYSSTAMGYHSIASGYFSTAMGHYTAASGDYSTAMGYYTTALGDYSTAMGCSIASGDYSTAMGEGASAWGRASTAMGEATSTLGDYSTAMGFYTTASGSYSTAMGDQTKAYSCDSFALGRNNVGAFATGGDTQWIETDPVLEIGNGEDWGTPSNAVTIMKNADMRTGGKAEFKRGVRVPQQGDLSMGDFTAGNNPADLDPTLGLKYQSE